MFHSSSTRSFDWAGAIERNREALAAIVAGLFAMLGSQTGSRLPQSLHRAVLRILRPAESAARRLIAIAARGLVVKPAPARPFAAKPIGKGGQASPRFQLFDPVTRVAIKPIKLAPRVEPRIHFFSYDPRVAALWARRPSLPPVPVSDGLVSGNRLVRRMQALKSALDDLPRQALRLARQQLKQKTVTGLMPRSPVRRGQPPGHRAKPMHEIDEILAECHYLARDALRFDSS